MAEFMTNFRAQDMLGTAKAAPTPKAKASKPVAPKAKAPVVVEEVVVVPVVEEVVVAEVVEEAPVAVVEESASLED